jgi:hypothetical protein
VIVSYAVPTEGTSPLWARNFALGCGGTVSKENTLQPGDVALFGSADRWQLLQQAQREARTWYYGDHAYFGRRNFFRITRNAYQHDGQGKAPAAPFESFGIPVRPWRLQGRNIILCPNSPAYFAMHGSSVDQWIRETAEQLEKHTDRPIIFRFKDDSASLEQALQDAWACVVYTSVSGVHAALAGVPCFATEQCASLSFGTADLSRIESPVRPENRFDMACVLASNQWAMADIASGMAWRALNEQKGN